MSLCIEIGEQTATIEMKSYFWAFFFVGRRRQTKLAAMSRLIRSPVFSIFKTTCTSYDRHPCGKTYLIVLHKNERAA